MEKIQANNIIMEIRAGTGGEEAALFVANLFKMYSKFAQKQNWPTNILGSHSTSLGGFKEIILEIKGEGVYDNLKNESGVHRVQRIPSTEKIGRIHTSTATVAVLPQAKEIDIRINPQDIKIDVARASGPGGQHVNKTETAIRVTHLPTGLTAFCQNERSQLKNKEKALSVLRAKLFQLKQQEQNAKIGQERRQQIGEAERAEKIRTYNFPQNRITDHRLNKSWHNLEDILEGNLKPIIKTFQKLKK